MKATTNNNVNSFNNNNVEQGYYLTNLDYIHETN